MLSSAARNRKYLGLHHESVDSKIKFTIEPLPGNDAFDQWKDAMKAVAGLSMGIPVDYRKKVWLALADNYLNGLCIDWEKTQTLAFNRKSNPDDNKLDQQILKDLHRTGRSGYSGDDNDEERAVLQRVLLAYARWNKQVGYCQGFNVIAALILDVMDRQEDSALKVMIYLIDRVLPESYFANNLRALSVDMAVFRHLLRLQLPKFSQHLDQLQASSVVHRTGPSYEPPLTDVFTMQWFLTLFATCLPKSTTLRIWDAVVLEGSEVLLKTAVSIWEKLQERLLVVQTPDEFYTTMGSLNQEMLNGTFIDEDALIKTVYEMTSLSSITVGLTELRLAYSKRLAAVTAARTKWLSSGGRASDSDVSSLGLGPGDLAIDVTCFTGMLPFPQQSASPQRSGHFSRSSSSVSLSDATQCSGGLTFPPLDDVEKIAVDVGFLSKQYARLQERQRQARVILSGGARQNRASGSAVIKPTVPSGSSGSVDAPIGFSTAVNHLYIGREMALNARNPTSTSSSMKTATNGRRHHRQEQTRSTRINNSSSASSSSCCTSSSVEKKSVSDKISSPRLHTGHRSSDDVPEMASSLSSSMLLGDAVISSPVATKSTIDCTSERVSDGVETETESSMAASSAGGFPDRRRIAVSLAADRAELNNDTDASKLPLPVMPNLKNHELTANSTSSTVDRSGHDGSDDGLHRKSTVTSSVRSNSDKEIVSASDRAAQCGCLTTPSSTASSSHCIAGQSMSQSRLFSPFPKQFTSKSTRRRQELNGVRLGMYAATGSSAECERSNHR